MEMYIQLTQLVPCKVLQSSIKSTVCAQNAEVILLCMLSCLFSLYLGGVAKRKPACLKLRVVACFRIFMGNSCSAMLGPFSTVSVERLPQKLM